jgi:hypothetical protein
MVIPASAVHQPRALKIAFAFEGPPHCPSFDGLSRAWTGLGPSANYVLTQWLDPREAGRHWGSSGDPLSGIKGCRGELGLLGAQPLADHLHLVATQSVTSLGTAITWHRKCFYFSEWARLL